MPGNGAVTGSGTQVSAQLPDGRRGQAGPARDLAIRKASGGRLGQEILGGSRGGAGFAIIMGVEHLLAAFPLGAVGSFSSCGAIAPGLCNRFYAALVANEWETAQQCQYKITKLYKLFKDQYPSSLKGAMISMGRAVGPTRPPLPTASPERVKFLCEQLEVLGVRDTEPHGW